MIRPDQNKSIWAWMLRLFLVAACLLPTRAGAYQVSIALLVGLAATVANGAFAEEYTVSIKGKSFSPKVLRIKPGDTIRFVNDDSVTHDVYSLTRGHLFTSGRREPGKESSSDQIRQSDPGRQLRSQPLCP